MTSYLLIDQGYFVFYRFYAIQQWYRHSHPDSDHDKMENDQEFLDMLKKRLLTSLEQLVKKEKIDWKNVFICCDGARSSLWRTQTLKTDYKSHRSAPSAIKFAFQYMEQHAQELKLNRGLHVLKNPNMEADDIVATSHAFLRESHPDAMITIIAVNCNGYNKCNDCNHRTYHSCFNSLQ